MKTPTALTKPKHNRPKVFLHVDSDGCHPVLSRCLRSAASVSFSRDLACRVTGRRKSFGSKGYGVLQVRKKRAFAVEHLDTAAVAAWDEVNLRQRC